ncbi:pirin domain-containing protein [Calothrix sp. NIES-4101]|nr:pirin domain-containing protein [Calothrix sp. NIES-4101]
MSSKIEKRIQPHIKELGGFQARRLLPNQSQAMVGSFIFFDHLGPATFPPGKGVDVRPHPHINLATVTYLFEGVLLHRDSLGFVQEIRPGEVNWMTAGSGIVHSERTPENTRTHEATLHAIQTWIALPEEYEEVPPSFHHYPATTLPQWNSNGSFVTLIAGKACGYESPVKVFSPMLYLDVKFDSNASFILDPEYSDRAIYTVTPGIVIDGEAIEQHSLIILKPGDSVEISSNSAARCVIIGGEPVGQRQKWWNFVSSSRERIEQAKLDWKEGRFDTVPTETEFIPLPDESFLEGF